MADVFISYSRQDSVFVQQLNTAFTRANRVVWVDWQNIPRGHDWWKEIQIGIEEADAFICVISEHWLTSEICHKELAYAREHNKQVVPLIRQRIEDSVEKQVKGTWMDRPYEETARTNWEQIRHLNWTFFDEDAKFAETFQDLLQTLEEDQAHIKAHTRYQNKALEWQRTDENPSFLLTGTDLAFAENWLKLAQKDKKEPAPTQVQQDFIVESRRDEDKRIAEEQKREKLIKQFRITSFGLAIAAASFAIFGIFSIWTAIDAEQRRDAAETARVQAELQWAKEDKLADALYDAFTENLPRALAKIEGLVQTFRDDAELYFIRGMIYRTAGEEEKANTNFERVLEIDPDFKFPFIFSITVDSEEPRNGEEPDNIVDILDIQSLQLSALDIENSQWGIMTIQMGEYDIVLFGDANNPEFSEFLESGANSFIQKDYEAALADFDRALEFRSDIAHAYNLRGVTYDVLGDYDRAIEDYNRALELDATANKVYTDGILYNNRALANRHSGNYDLAMIDYQLLIEEGAGSQVYASVGITYALMGSYESALEYFNIYELSAGASLPDWAVEYREQAEAAVDND